MDFGLAGLFCARTFPTPAAQNAEVFRRERNMDGAARHAIGQSQKRAHLEATFAAGAFWLFHKITLVTHKLQWNC